MKRASTPVKLAVVSITSRPANAHSEPSPKALSSGSLLRRHDLPGEGHAAQHHSHVGEQPEQAEPEPEPQRGEVHVLATFFVFDPDSGCTVARPRDRRCRGPVTGCSSDRALARSRARPGGSDPGRSLRASFGASVDTRLTIGSCDWKLIDPSNQIAPRRRGTAGTSMRRPAGEVPSTSTSTTPSAAPIQNERRRRASGRRSAAGCDSSIHSGGRARASTPRTGPSSTTMISQFATGS